MLKRNVLANYFGQGWAALIGLAFIPIYIRYLGVEAYGIIGIFTMLGVWLSLLDMGMTPVLSREMARFTAGAHSPESIRDLLRSVEVVALAILVAICALFVLTADLLARYWVQAQNLSVESIADAFLIMGFVTGLRFVEGIYRSTLVGLERQVLFNIVNAILATVRAFGAVVVLALFSPTLTAFFFWQGIISMISVIVLGAFTYRVLPRIGRHARPSLARLKPVWRYASGVMSITVLAILLTQIDKIILSRLLVLSEFGQYALAATVAGGLYASVNPIGQAFYPRLCAQVAAARNTDLADTYHLGAQLVSVVGGSLAIVLAFQAEIILRLWTQDPSIASATAPLVTLLVLGNLLNGLVQMPYNIQLAYGRTQLIIGLNAIAICFTIPALLWLVPQFGSVGAASVWVGLNAGYVLIGVNLMLCRTLRTERWLWYFEDVFIPLVASVSVNALFCLLWPWGRKSWIDFIGIILVVTTSLFFSAIAAGRVRVRFFQRFRR